MEIDRPNVEISQDRLRTKSRTKVRKNLERHGFGFLDECNSADYFAEKNTATPAIVIFDANDQVLMVQSVHGAEALFQPLLKQRRVIKMRRSLVLEKVAS